MTFKPKPKSNVFFVLMLLLGFLAVPDANAQRKKNKKDKKGKTEIVDLKKKASEKSMAIYNLKIIRKFAGNGIGDLATKAHKTHLKTLIDNTMKEIK